jgi:hypothetical protein
MIPFPFQTGGFGLAGGAATPGVAAVTWNPSDKSASIALSGGNLIATQGIPTDFESVRATLSRSSGKYYFEVAAGAGGAGNTVVGLAESGLSLATYTGATATSYGFYQLNGQKLNNGSATAFGSAWAGPSVVGVAVDLTAGLLWFAIANTWQASGNPAAGTNAAFSGLTGAKFPTLTLYDNGRTGTGRFKASDFTYSPPSGFSAWES